MERFDYGIMEEMQKRYAVKHFRQEAIAREELLPLLEAARSAPSCFNEQPWRFLVGDTPEPRGKLADALTPGNAWAKGAPVLILVLCTTRFRLNDKPNGYCRFDAGTASGFLQLEAVRRGFAVHCMAGFHADKAREAFDIPEELDIVELIALGRPAPKGELTEEQKKQEQPGDRKALAELLLN